MRVGLMIVVAACAVFHAPEAPAQAPAPAKPGSTAQSSSPEPSSPPTSSPSSSEPIAVAPPASLPILVVGGTRGTGLEIVKLLRSRGQSITVMARPTSDATALEQLHVPVIRADAVDAAQVKIAIAPGQFRAVISTLGARRREKTPPDFEGNRNLIDAAKAAGIRRFVMISTIGAGSSAETASLAAKLMFGDVMTLKTRAEEHLAVSGLDYTVIRPGGLLDKEPSGKAVLSEDPEISSWIARADLAQLVADALDDQTTIGHVYNAYDETRERFWARWQE
jgi:uncharacterized protein YbjT (DUF2867 family)